MRHRLPPVRTLVSPAMSEKRHRKQQRRARRRSRPHVRSATSDRGTRSERYRAAADVEASLDELLSDLAEIAAGGADEPGDALDAEQWASGLLGTFRCGPLQDAPVADRFGDGLVAALAELGSAGALATLRAIGALTGEACAPPARAAADRLAGAGVSEPDWASALGRVQPTAAGLVSDPAFDDGVSVLLEFADPDGDSHTVGVYIDHNMGGLVKDVFLVGPLAEVREAFATNGGHEAGLVVRELDLGEARARVEQALDILDHTLDPPVDDDVWSLRAFVGARIKLLPTGVTLPNEYTEVAPEVRARLLSEFLGSPEGHRWRADEDAAAVAALAIDFGADYNHGGPLRWSPVVVEIFMTNWLARKVSMEREFFERVPEVLPDWVAYAGRRRGVPSAAVGEAVAAVELYRDELLEAVDDPQGWGPAKAFVLAAQQEGVDLADPHAVEQFVERYDDGLAA
jgi:hypothetical protein